MRLDTLSGLAIRALALSLFACGAAPSTDSGDQEVTSSKMATLLKSAQHVAYVDFATAPSPDVVTALVAAAQRGVDARAILVVADHDSTWLVQQQLEASGVDVDVHATDPLPGLRVVVDAKALEGAALTVDTNAAKVDAFKKQFLGIVETPASNASPALVTPETVKVHPMPESTRAPVLAALRAAKSTIDIELYQLEEREVVQSLIDAAAAGVTVRVMLEPKTVGYQNYKPVVAQLSAGGVKVQSTPSQFDSHGNVDHAKFCIIDGKELLYGTGNLVRSGLGGVTEQPYDNRDFWIEDGRAATITEAQALFTADWAQKSTQSMTFQNLVVTPDNANTRIEALVDGARTRLYVYNQSLSDSTLIQKLIAKQKAGVDVQVLLGYQPPTNGVPSKNAATLNQLTQGGVSAALLKHNYLHAKGIVADDQAYLGSQNFTSGGLQANRELGEIFDDAALVKRVVEVFQSDFAKPE